jgi:tRNA (mo5U34)-methyltransferase
MKLYRKAARVIADEGIVGLWKRSKEKILRTRGDRMRKLTVDPAIHTYQALYKRDLREFQQKALALGYTDIHQYYWYHTVDLGDGLITPGDFDYRSNLLTFHFPSSMAGMDVLDVGSATGFFAFDFEKRGANVISVELPSIADWDMPTGEDRERTLANLMRDHQTDTVEGAYHYHLDGPFQFCHKILKSKVRRVYSTIYELSADKLGMKQFDIIFLGDVLLHTFAPLKALAALSPLCRGTLIITEHLWDEDEHAQPLMFYAGGATPALDRRTWWYPNKACMDQMLKRLGFQSVQVVGHPNVIYRPEGKLHQTAVIHARKQIG